MTARKKDARRYLYILPVMLWMAFIFFMSSQDAGHSSQLSGGITEKICDILQPLRDDTTADRLQFTENFENIIRKLAHMAEYAVLFGLILLAVRKINYDYKRTYIYILSIVISFLYACTDEFHQLFVNGRSGSMVDVAIDMCGVFICMLLGFAMKDKKWRIIAIFSIALIALISFLLLLFYKS